QIEGRAGRICFSISNGEAVNLCGIINLRRRSKPEIEDTAGSIAINNCVTNISCSKQLNACYIWPRDIFVIVPCRNQYRITRGRRVECRLDSCILRWYLAGGCKTVMYIDETS